MPNKPKHKTKKKLTSPTKTSSSIFCRTLILLFLVSLTGGAIFLLKNPEVVTIISPRPERLPTKHPPLASPLPAKKTSARIDLYFSDPQSDFLAKEARMVRWNKGDPKDQIDVIVNELIKGPQGDLQQTIPSNVRLRNIVIKKKGVGVIDLSKELSQNHPGGTLAEMHTIYSLVNSLLLNIASLKQVQILVEGQAPETLKGHIDCRNPFDLNRSIIKPG